MTAGGESDIGSVDGMMPEEVEAAYQVFIQYFSSSKLEYRNFKWNYTYPSNSLFHIIYFEFLFQEFLNEQQKAGAKS